MGPDLTNVGTHRAPDYILQAIVDPGAALPVRLSRVVLQQVPGRGFNEYLVVRAITADGRKIRGVRVKRRLIHNSIERCCEPVVFFLEIRPDEFGQGIRQDPDAGLQRQDFGFRIG